MKRLAWLLEERTLAVALLAGGILLGLCWPSLARLLEPYSAPALFLVMVLSLLPFARMSQGALIGIDGLGWRIVLWQLVMLPLLAVSAGVVCRLPEQMISLMLVTACAGSLFSSPGLASLLQLDGRRTLQGMVLSTILMPFSLYAFLSLVNGSGVSLNLSVYLNRSVIFLALPFAIFILYRSLTSGVSEAVKTQVETWSRWGMVAALIVFGIGTMSAVSERLTINPGQVLYFFVVATALCVAMLLATLIVMHRYGLDNSMTAGILCGLRNIGLSYALVGNMMGRELSVYVGISLLPVFLAPLIIRLLTTIWPQLREAGGQDGGKGAAPVLATPAVG